MTKPQPFDLMSIPIGTLDSICPICEEGPAVTDDGPIRACMACIFRMGDWVNRPWLLTVEMVDNLKECHGDIVDLHIEQTVTGYPTPFGFVATSSEEKLHWHWNDDVHKPGVFPRYRLSEVGSNQPV